MPEKYPYTDFSQLNLDWFLNKFKDLLEEQTRVSQKVLTLDETVLEFTNFVTHYFDDLDVQTEINNKLNEMYMDGSLKSIVAPYVINMVPADVSLWLSEHVNPVGSAVTLDDTLSIEGSAADAAAAGDAIRTVKNDVMAVDLNGKYLSVVAAGDQTVRAKIASANVLDHIWVYGDNMLPLMTGGTVANGITVTIDDDGSIDLNGTTTSSSNVNMLTSMFDVPAFYKGEPLSNYILSYDLNAGMPNTSGYVIIRVIDDQDRNAVVVSLNSASALSGSTISPYLNCQYFKRVEIYFYNIPIGTTFNHVGIRVKMKYAPGKTDYTEPSLSDTQITPSYGIGYGNIALKDGINHLITTAETMYITADVKKNAEVYTGKRWACFGDSLTQKDAAAISSGQLRYFDPVSEELGLSVINYGRATTGYANNGNVENGAYHLRMPNIVPDAFDFMTIMGSTNDIGPLAQQTIQLGNYDDTGTTTVCGCINTTLDAYYALAPLKPIGMISMLPTYAYGPNLIDTAVCESYVAAQKQICENRGIPFLDLYHSSGMRPWINDVKDALYLNSDGIHPNNEGIKWFAPAIREFIKKLM